MADPLRAEHAIGLAFGILLHLVVGAFYLATGLVAPPLAASAMIAAWLAFGVLLWHWRRAPIRALLLPFGEAALWFAVVSAGEAWFGWSA